MKIALPSRQGWIDDHFGHCEAFTVFTVDLENQAIVHAEIVPSPAGCGCKSNIASVLAEMGVGVMLAGNMGEGAVNVLGASGIQVLRGCSGRVEEVAKAWLNGALVDTGESCHAHEHNCGGH